MCGPFDFDGPDRGKRSGAIHFPWFGLEPRRNLPRLVNPQEIADLDRFARTPWWLILLRMLLAALVILALSHPLLNPASALRGSGPLVLVIDDDWAAAANWP